MKAPSARHPDFAPPAPPEHPDFVLEPLRPVHAELDYQALMGSRLHLRRTLDWGTWPREDFSLPENRKDLARHGDEFDARVAYAYTVLSPDRSQCYGCCYLNPEEENPRDAVLAYWVIQPLSDRLDLPLLFSVVNWIDTEWPIDRLRILARPAHRGARRAAAAMGFAEADEDFLSR